MAPAGSPRRDRRVKVLVTGGAGFIGSWLVDRLVAEGHDAVVVDNLFSGDARQVHDKAAFYHLDIRDRQALNGVLAIERPQIVSHHAGQVSVRRSVTDPAHDASVNVVGFLNVLEASLCHGVERIVFASSGGTVYGEQDTFPADEAHPLRPVSPYGVAKMACEHYLRCFHAMYVLPFVVLRYGNVYGPRQNPRGGSGMIALFVDRLLQGKPVHINGDGHQTRDFVYVDDVVEANMLAMHATDPEVFNVGTGVETAVNDVFDRLKRLVCSSVSPEHGPAEPGEQRRSVLNVDRIARQLDWQPRTALADGLARTVAYFALRTEATVRSFEA